MPRQVAAGGPPPSPSPRQPVSIAVLLLYNVVFLVGLVCYLPFIAWKMLWHRSYRQGIRERMGWVPRSTTDNVLWVHGVSVGEVKASVPLVRALEAALPGVDVVISATTPTGHDVARQEFPDRRVIFYPLDFAHFPGRAMDRIRPRCVLLLELELWPNFLNAAERRGIPVAVVNGRISLRSWRGYRRVSQLLPQLDRIDVFAVQDDIYAARLRDLGVSADKIWTTGNMKYDRLRLSVERVAPDPDLAALLAVEEDEAVVVAGSTHADEESRLAAVTADLEAGLGRRIRLIVAPRHPDRSAAVADDLRRVLRDRGRLEAHPVVRLTTQRAAGQPCPPGAWLVVDTIGELERAYSLADVVFVGGSLVHHGGQNMLEPVALGKPTIVGPHTVNFRSDMDLLLAGEGIVQVANDDELRRQLEFLLSHREEAARLAQRAQRVVQANLGATQRTLQRILALLGGPAEAGPAPARVADAVAPR